MKLIREKREKRKLLTRVANDERIYHFNRREAIYAPRIYSPCSTRARARARASAIFLFPAVNHSPMKLLRGSPGSGARSFRGRISARNPLPVADTGFTFRQVIRSAPVPSFCRPAWRGKRIEALPLPRAHPTRAVITVATRCYGHSLRHLRLKSFRGCYARGAAPGIHRSYL